MLVRTLVATAACACALGCSEPAPTPPAAPPGRVVATFGGEGDAGTGVIRFWSEAPSAVAGTGTAPRAGRQALVEIPVSQDGVPGTGAPDTVELVTESAGTIPGGCGAMDGFEGSVRVRSFFAGRRLENVHAEITSLTPSGREACNSVLAAPGTSGVHGLFRYGALATAGAAGDSAAVPWRFRLPDQGRFTFQGRILADLVAPCSGGPGFPGAPTLAGGTVARGMVTGDLDGDGSPDLVFLHSTGTDVVWGDGRAGAAASLTMSGMAQDVELGDVDGDGRLDVVLAVANTLVVRRNTGGRTFAAAVTIPVAASGTVTGLALGDLSGDGKLDVAAIHSGNVNGPYSLFTLRNGSTGPGSVAFTAASSNSVADQAYAVAMADWNGDGRKDVAVAVTYSFFAKGVSLHLGAGDGSVLSGTMVATSANAVAVAGPDVDGDGRADLVVLGALAVRVLLNQGAGPYPALPTFGPAVSYPVTNAMELAVGDLNGDGRVDVATAGTGKVSYLLNQGGGALAAAVTRTVGPSPYGVVMADLDRDGALDLATVDNSDGRLYPLLNAGGATFPGPVEYATGSSPMDVGAADLDGDGDLDLALPTFSYGGVTLLRNQGDGTFAAWTTLSTGGQTDPNSIALADLSGDGWQDVAVTKTFRNQVAVFLSNGAGGFAAAVDYAVGAAPQTVAAGDVNGDGLVDLVVASTTGKRVDLLLGQGGGAFVAGTPLATSAAAYHALVTDVNLDGLADVVVRLTDLVAVFLGRTDHTFDAPASYAAPGTARLAVADLDGDGAPEVVVAGGGASAGLGVLRNTGSGTLLPISTSGWIATPWAVAVADLDGDGKPDAAVTENDANNGAAVHVFLGDGAGGFGPGARHPTGKGPRGIVAADLDGDARADLAVSVSGTSSTAGVLMNRCWPGR